MRDDRILLKDILEAINAIERFIEGIDFESFSANDEKSSAVSPFFLPLKCWAFLHFGHFL